VDDEQNAQFGVIVLVDDSERRAGNGLVTKLVARVAETVLRVPGKIGIDDLVEDLQLRGNDIEAELRQPLGERRLQAVNGGS
jgi:hypothetical protein